VSNSGHGFFAGLRAEMADFVDYFYFLAGRRVTRRPFCPDFGRPGTLSPKLRRYNPSL
jgi:hypothetical protein